jgi:hypothetical protein
MWSKHSRRIDPINRSATPSPSLPRNTTYHSYRSLPRRPAIAFALATGLSYRNCLREIIMRSTLPNGLARTVHGFFGPYLLEQRGLSRHTVLSYRDTLALLLRFIAQTRRPDPAALEVPSRGCPSASRTMEERAHQSLPNIVGGWSSACGRARRDFLGERCDGPERS